MHLIAIENCPTTKAGGQERSLFDICRGLSRRGVDVTLLYAEAGDLLPEYERFCSQTKQVRSRYLTKTNGLRFVADLVRARRWTRNLGPAVVYGNQYFDLPFACALGRSIGARVCCHLRLDVPAYMSRQYRLGLRLADACITVSHATRRAHLAGGSPPATTHVVHNGIDPAHFTPADGPRQGRASLRLPEDAFVVLYAGRICRDKAVDVLVDAVARVAARGADVRLVIAGPRTLSAADQEYGQGVLRQVDRLGLAERVRLCESVADIVSLYRAADVTVLPSRYEEPFGRVLIESMACGIPAVGTAVGGIPEILCGEFARFCIAPDAPNALADAIGALTDWRRAEPDLGIRCRRHVLANFTVERTIDGVASILFPRGWERQRRCEARWRSAEYNGASCPA